MNAVAQQEFAILDQTWNMRHELLNVLTDDDLAFKIEGNPTLGDVLAGLVATEQRYADSFTTGKHDWLMTLDDPDLATSVEALKAGFAKTEVAFKNAFANLSDDEANTKMIDRHGMHLPVRVHFHVYREAFLIDHAKVVVYLNAMGKELPPQLQLWIG